MKQPPEKQTPKSSDFESFLTTFNPLEAPHVQLLTDYRTKARYCECHIKAEKLIALGTTDVPLDPEEQAEYRANREVVEDAPAFERMLADARERRTFSNIVTEYTAEFDKETPLKIIGGQHRFQAIKSALDAGVTELFFLQTEKGDGITKNIVDVAIAKFHAKQATLEVEKLKAKG